MKRVIYAAACIIVLLFSVPKQASAQNKPIALNTLNPHYFVYKKKPTVLITSGEHYGAVLNTAFDYTTYLKTLAADGLNLTRTFSGAYHEPKEAFNISHNVMAPSSATFICPWARSDEPGFKDGGNKFDLNKWDDNYFTRLKAFISAAQQRGIIVEFTFFCPFYDNSQWVLSPMNSINNINGVGNIAMADVYTMDKNGALLAVQDKMVQKIVTELQGFDNLMYEICNEPYFGGVTPGWQYHIAKVITEAEKGFANKHLITQNIANESAKVINPFEEVSVFNFHYAWPPVTVAINYGLNRAIGNNETGFKGNADSTYRMQGWRFMLAGGALYNNLDYSFTTGYEKGDFKYDSTTPGGGTIALRKQLGYLKKFMDGFDFTKMQPDSTTVTGGLPDNVVTQTLAEPGKQYAIYVYGGKQVNLQLKLPAGRYQVEWFNTLTGKYTNKNDISHEDHVVIISSPAYTEDIAVKITRIYERYSPR